MSIVTSIILIISLFAGKLNGFLGDNHKKQKTEVIIIPASHNLNNSFTGQKAIKIKTKRYTQKHIELETFNNKYRKKIFERPDRRHVYQIYVGNKYELISRDIAITEDTQPTHNIYILESFECKCCDFVEELGKRAKMINNIFKSKDTLTALQNAAHPGSRRTWSVK
ncbi:hypothetical protein CDIK_3327 [Cucumispora dikerogammari]|nr:hypothetical protein CDIK_3327 [Cucumispora dikerogammari]